MFSKKKTSLFETKAKQGATVVKNPFVNAGLMKSAETRSGNGSLKYSTTGNDFVDQFGKLGNYKNPRSFEDISKDAQLLWSQNALVSVMFIVYLRIITRVVTLFNGVKTTQVQRGAGLKHESIMRMIWLHVNHADAFWNNIVIFISAGSWQDIFKMLQYDLIFNGWENRQLDWKKFGDLVLAGLENPNSSELVKKYLPQIKATSKCTTVEAQADTLIGKWLCGLLYPDKKDKMQKYKAYRLLKSSGKAHVWQQLISKAQYLSINFSTVHGRALSLLVSSKFLKNQGLEQVFKEWIVTQPVAKYTGYVHELFKDIRPNLSDVQKLTINKQFDGLIETGRKNAKANSKLIVVRDTSGSMAGLASGTKFSCYDIGKALALYFSAFLDGAFKDSWIEFNSTATMHQWKGENAVDKWLNDHSGFFGSTNFMSVASLFVNIKKRGISESEFPTGILCISDGEFNPSQLGKTNVESFRDILRSAGFSKEYVSSFKIILWNLQSRYYGSNTGSKFESYGNVENVFYFSGYEASVIAFLTGVEGQKSDPKTAEELFQAAMNQELLNLIKL